jgi:hypothetical protein
MPSRVRPRATLALLPALLALTACATPGASTDQPFADGREEVRIRIQNDNFYDARVYALVDGVRRQLGYVGGKTDRVFTMPLSFSQVLRLQFDILAGPTCTTEALTVDPGDLLQLQILSTPLTSDFCR